MIKCDVKVFVQFKDGVWAIESVGFWNKFGLTGQRVTLVVTPMSKREIRDAMPNLADRMTNNCVVVWGHPVAAEQSRGGEEPAPFIPVGEPLSATMTPDQIAEAVVNPPAPAFSGAILIHEDQRAVWLPKAAGSGAAWGKAPKYILTTMSPDEFASWWPFESVEPVPRVHAPRGSSFIELNALVESIRRLLVCTLTVPPKPKTTIEVPIPSYEERVAKIEKIAESAQRAVELIFRSKPYAPAVPEPMELRHARMDVEDLRKKLDDARKELRYQRAVAPKGSRFVQGFVSSVKGRQTPNQGCCNAYANGQKIGAVEAHTGADGFAIVRDSHDPTKLRLLTGIIHVVEFEGLSMGLPESLEFRP